MRSMVKKPCAARTLPMPPQVRQVVGAVPALERDGNFVMQPNCTVVRQ